MNYLVKQNRATIVVALMIASLTLPFTGSASAETEQARVKNDPWSGYWWPISRGEIVGPLSKYDSLSGSTSAAWERKNNPAGEHVPAWFGYCHAWAASAIMEKEPTEVVNYQSQALGIGDQKGLLAVCHANDVANSFGDRFGDKRGSEDPNDLTPDNLWMLLKRHIREQGVPLVLDIEPGDQVWNYPVFAYQVDYAPVAGGSSRYRGTIAIWMADDAVPMDFVGVKRLFKKYPFEVTMSNGSVVMGSGKWIGTSEQNHPDFAWFPYVVRPENPEVSYSKVTKILGSQPAEENTPSSDSTPSVTTPNTQPSTPSPANTIPNPTPAITTPGTTTPGITTPSDDQPSSVPGGELVETKPEPVLLDPIDLVSLIATQTSDFELDITVDHFDGGKYNVGDLVSIAGRSEQDGYLYLLAIDTSGVPSLLFPQPGNDNRVEGGAEFAIPSQKAKYQFRLHQPYGEYRIKGIVCDKPLEFSGLLIAEQSPPARKDEVGKSKPPTKSSMKPASKPDVALDKQKFRWNPAQLAQVKTLLGEYTSKGKLGKERVDGITPGDILGEFAQDEVTFYVGPNADRPTTPAKKK